MSKLSLGTLAVVAVVLLAGCAKDWRYAQGLDWVTENEAQKARLNSQGFPQYTNGPG